MYKILVTTTFKKSDGSVVRGYLAAVSCHTQVIEFSNLDDAKNAADIINKRKSSEQSAPYEQDALCLFK